MPSKIEAETAAYKPYRSVYRLCYSFHSSYEEIVDFVETIKPQNLKVIALPESTSELDVNKFFYGESSIAMKTIRKTETISNASLNTLVLRKRKSTLDFTKSDSESDNNDDDDDLCFGLNDKIVKFV